MQAIILAAGMGKRLGEYTKSNTKCMVEVNGEHLVDRVINQLVKFGIDRLIMVVGYESQRLIDYLGHRYDDVLKIEYIKNPIYEKTNNIYSLALAKDVLCEDDTILLESDLIFEDKLIELLVKNPYPNLALVAKYESWMDGTMVTINGNNDIVNFIPKGAFRYEDVDIYYKTINIYKFSKYFSRSKYVPFLEAYCKVMGFNEYYEEVLRVITLLHKSDLKAVPIKNEKWYEIDDVQDLDIASTIFADGVVQYQEYHKRYGGFWRFPQLLDFCYLVNPYFPTKRMLDEMRANFDTLLSDYPSGMYVNSLLAAKYFGIKHDYIIVGNGAAELIKIFMEEYSSNNVGMIFPTFEEYPNRLQEQHIVGYTPNNERFSYTADDIMSFFSDKNISLLLLINPDNPSGNFIQKSDVLNLSSWCKHRKIKLLIDESFVDFTNESEGNSLLDNDVLVQNPNLIVIKSISKSYGVPGLRLGVLATSDTDLVNRIRKIVPIWNINSFGEFYMQIYSKYEKDYKLACKDFIKERNFFYEKLSEIPFLRVVPSQANFFLCEVKSKYTSKDLSQKLIEKNVLIKNCSSKQYMTGKQFIRIAIRDRKDNEKLIEILNAL